MDKITILIILCTLCVILGAVIFFVKKRRKKLASYKGGTPSSSTEIKKLPFPYRSSYMPSAISMFSELKYTKFNKIKVPGFKTTIVRTHNDLDSTDFICEHYTEELKARYRKDGRHSLMELWKNKKVKDAVVARGKKLCKSRRSESGVSLEGKLISCVREQLDVHGGADVDTNPALVMYILKKVGKKLGKEPRDIKIVDAGVGWGGQALGACAFGAGCYHGYVPYSRERKELADALEEAMSVHCSYVGDKNYWTRTMEVSQSSPTEEYDVAFSSTSDLTPLLGGTDSPLAKSLKKPGYLVLFVPPGKLASKRAEVAIRMLVGEVPKWNFGIKQELGDNVLLSKAFVWKFDS